MESELLNAVNYAKNISKKKVTFAKTEALRGRKSYSLAKKILIILLIHLSRKVLIQVREDGENAAF